MGDEHSFPAVAPLHKGLKGYRPFGTFLRGNPEIHGNESHGRDRISEVLKIKFSTLHSLKY